MVKQLQSKSKKLMITATTGKATGKSNEALIPWAVSQLCFVCLWHAWVL